MAELFCAERGTEADGLPIVLLHGFGGSHAAWREVVARIGDARRMLAFDLPGHCGSLGVPGGAGLAAKAVLAALEGRGVERAHLVGHSMGGAAAALMALRNPGRIASLTLLAPGGFGPEIDQELLRRYAAATEESQLTTLLAQFFGGPLPEGLAAAQAEERRAAGASAALQSIVETFFEGADQKLLPIADLARLAMPIKVAWGSEDRVLPSSQARRLPDPIQVRIFAGAGHMLPYEIPDEIADLVLESTR